MEVHQHSHTARKKWTHYFWEFLMLFLAVFCGFLAENQREHIVEHRKEKDFMRSMIDDLKKDTVAIIAGIAKLEKQQKNSDSAILLYIVQKSPTPAQVAEIGRISDGGLTSTIVLFTDRTSSQLKNSGGMRLIRDKSVADFITEYWNRIDQVKEIIDRTESYRLDTRKLGTGIFGGRPGFYAHRYLDSTLLIDSDLLLDNSPLLLGEYMNNMVFISILYRFEYIPRLRNQLKLAQRLMDKIREDYHLK